MKEQWSLDELYSSFDSEAFKKDYALLEGSTELYKDLVHNKLSSNYKESILEYLKFQKKYNAIAQKLYAFSVLSFSGNTKNIDALKYMEKMDEILSDHTAYDYQFNQWLSKIEDLEAVIASDKLIEEHGFYLRSIKEKQNYKMSEKEEVLASKMAQTGSSSWSTLQEKIASQLMVELEMDGEVQKLPLMKVRNMAYKKEQSLRKKAYEAELKAYNKQVLSSVSALNGIKGEVLTLSKLRGFDSPLAESLFKSRLSKKALDAMLQAMKESLPEFKKYFLRKASLLGHKEKLPFYDLFAPIGEGSKEFTYDEAKDFIITHFGDFSSELSDYAKKAFENQWIDVYPREGKRGGAFCYNLPAIKESRILTNFTGSFSDVMTLAHELGHGFHGHNLVDESILNTSYPMPLAETASIFCETIVKNAVLKTATKEEKITILESSLQSASQVIVDIYSRFIFESKFFDLRKDHSLSVEETKNIMLEAQREAYAGSLDEDNMHPYMWMCKTHYYSAGFNFYNYPYAFGLLFALGLYNIYLKDSDKFISEYNDLLKLTGQAKAIDVAKTMNIDIEDVDFWKGSLNQVIKEIKSFIELTN